MDGPAGTALVRHLSGSALVRLIYVARLHLVPVTCKPKALASEIRGKSLARFWMLRRQLNFAGKSVVSRHRTPMGRPWVNEIGRLHGHPQRLKPPPSCSWVNEIPGYRTGHSDEDPHAAQPHRLHPRLASLRGRPQRIEDPLSLPRRSIRFTRYTEATQHRDSHEAVAGDDMASYRAVTSVHPRSRLLGDRLLARYRTSTSIADRHLAHPRVSSLACSRSHSDCRPSWVPHE